MAFTSTNITSAFKATGIHPYTPSIPLKQMRPYTPPCQIIINAQGQEPIII
jgi:hypothetical protein